MVDGVLVDIFEAGEPRFFVGDVRVVVVVSDAAAAFPVDSVECGGGEGVEGGDHLFEVLGGC